MVVVHDYSETLEGLSAFRGSKYVQSSIGQSYKQVESFLRGGRLVLFSGTPCQIAGLKRFLRKDYENLTTVDFICHGVPSPKVWRMYLKETGRTSVRKKYSFSLTLSLVKMPSLRVFCSEISVYDGKNTVLLSPSPLPLGVERKIQFCSLNL